MAVSGLPAASGFALAAWLAAALATVLLDRAGAPERLLGFIAPVLALAGLAAIGLAQRTMRISRFHAAGRALSGSQGAMAATALMLALAVPFAPPRADGPAWGDLLAAVALGGALATLATGPMLRKSGAFSLSGLLAGRFPALPLRLASLALAAAASALVFLAGLEATVDILTVWLGLSRAVAAAVACILLLLLCLPGGLAGVASAACAAFGLALAALAAPLAVHVWGGGSLPLALVGDREAMWSGIARLARYAAPGAPDSTATAIALGLGLAVLAPVAGLFAGSSNPGAARRASLGGLAWTAAAMAMALAVSILAAIGIDDATAGRKPEQLPAAFFTSAARSGLQICGRSPASPAAAAVACAARPGWTGAVQPGDVAPSAAALLTGIGRTRAAGTALAALAAAALMALALALAAAGLHGLGGALGNDLFHRLRDSAALTSRRLAITRAAMAAAVAGGGAATVWHTGEPRQLIAAAIALSAAFVAPLLLLALWPPATARDAATGLLAGGGFAILAAGRLGAAPGIDQAARAVLLVAATVLATGLAASLFHARPRPLSAFPRDLLRGTGDALPPDKGA